MVEDDLVLVTSCHGGKNLEFKKVVLLADNFSSRSEKIESELPWFYLGMMRAKEELILSTTGESFLARETGVSWEKIAAGDAWNDALFEFDSERYSYCLQSDFEAVGSYQKFTGG